MFGKNLHPNIQRSSPISLCGEGCSELHQQQGGAALWIYRRVQGLLGRITVPRGCWWLSSWSGGKWADENFNVKNFEMMSPAEVEKLLHYYRWIFGYFWVFWTFEDGKMVEQLVPRNSETASFATRWRANLVFGVVVGQDLRMSRRSEPLNGPMPKGQHVLW